MNSIFTSRAALAKSGWLELHSSFSPLVPSGLSDTLGALVQLIIDSCSFVFIRG
jgi:hypothetical protein